MSNWANIYVAETPLSYRAKKALMVAYGDAVMLGEVSEETVTRLKELPGMGAATVEEVLNFVASAISGEYVGGETVLEAAMKRVNPDRKSVV